MHIFISSNLGFRDKGYFSVNDYYSLNERVVSSCSYMGVFSTRGIAMSPRFVYGSRQSTLIRWSVCRSPFLGGSGYCQLAAPRCCCSCDCDRSCQGSRSLGQRQRERRVACVGWERDGFDSSGDESVHEMLSLLASSNDKKSSFKDRTKAKIRRQDVDEKEKNKRVDQRWKKEEKLVGSGSSGRSSKSETLVKSWEGYRLSRKDNSLKDDISDMRKDGSASSYYSASSGADLDNSLDLISTADQRFYTENESTMDMNLEDKVKAKHMKLGESSSSLKTDSRRESGRHLQKYEDERISSARREGKDKSDVMESHVECGSSKYSDTTSAISESRGSGTVRTSNAEKISTIRVENKEEDSTSFANLVQGAREQSIQKGKRFVGHNDSKIEARRLSRIRDGGAEIASSSEMAFNASVKDKETTSSAVNMIKEVREQKIQTDELTERIESQRKIQKLTNTSEVQSSDIEKASSYENLSKTRVDDKEEIWEASGQPAASNGRVIGQTESRIGFQRPSSTSETHVIGTEISNSSQKVSKTTTSSREENSGSYTNLIQEDREKQQQTSERLTRENVSTKESQRLTKIVEFRESDLGRASSSRKRAIKGMKNKEESSSSQLSLSTKLREGQMVLPRAEERESYSQSIASGSTNDRNPSSYKTPEAFRETLGHRNGRERDEIYEEHAEPIVTDALSSANRLEESSKQFVEEFVDKVQEEISTSQKFTISSKEEKYLQKDENISLDFCISLDDPRRSSSVGPAPKGPSDEMWAEAGQSSQEPYKTKQQKNKSSTVGAVESPGLTDAGSSIVRRSGRSLWAYIGDIVRRGWGSLSVTHTSTPKPSARFSPNESVSSESWFSGNEPDVDDGENVKKGRRGTQKNQPIGKFRDKPQASKTSIQSQEMSETTGVEEKVAQVKADISTSIGTVEIKGTLASGKNDLLRIEGAMETTTVGPTLTTVDTSLALLGTLPFSSLPLVDGATPPLMDSSLRPSSPLTTSTRKEEISEIGEVEVNKNDAMEVRVAPVQEKHAGATGTKGKEMELKRRKFQRNNQVLKERFDEWEEAFTLEQDQRKVDEMYMREALDEAKKAADTWEVPVGAVLVQHGKIIARGCNLVEELRDSTAHAEMICIREASNVLRTWRLAETTLYVTLEPCPMCAGAILQARIDTVVWGAPNKLLGADGSWVSLFPTGNDGTSSEQSNRPAGPVHPFHPKMTIRRGILATECAEVMQQFFHLRRKKIRKQEDLTGDPSCLPVSNPSKFFSKIHDLFGMMFCL